jgi:SAM-dependent methyltransferase
MKTSQNPWNDDYERRGRLWGGSAGIFPGLLPSSRILELGCGDGKTAAALVQAGCSVTAMDFSSFATKLCRKNCADPDRVRIVIADSRRTPFHDGSFDVIIASHITGHLSRSGRQCLASEVIRLLNSGGSFFFRDFSLQDFRYGHGEEIETGTFARKNGIATHYFTGDEVLTLFSGLAVQSIIEPYWEMRVRGRVLPRAEIVAEFRKPA